VQNQEDLYYSIKSNGEWQEAIPISNLNTSENEAAHSISADGRWLVFTICNRKESIGSCDLFISEWSGETWSRPKNMGTSINTPGWEAQPSLSADGNQLIFASNRQGGYGNYDLWISNREHGEWSNPKNLGDIINTPGKDETPFLHADGQTLYFSSDAHMGMGDSDLFMSRKGPDGRWQTPINLGYPINTKNREGALSVSLDGQTAYYASDRITESLTPNLDIFAFELPENLRPNPVTYLKVSLFDQESKTPLSGHVTIIELVHKKQLTTLPVNSEGSPIICLPTGDKYAFHVKVDDYQLHSEHFDLSSTKKKYKPYLLSIGLQKIKTQEAKPIVLNNIFFETGSSSLLNTSFIELDYLKTFLSEHPDIHIEIRGHTDNTGNDAFNQTLSNDRAHTVYEYLVSHGISRRRLAYRGFGSSLPVDSNDTAPGRQNNRRTEFMIINE
jgi:outer membrane protein OmpA-like peptidoglycan-associated protein